MTGRCSRLLLIVALTHAAACGADPATAGPADATSDAPAVVPDARADGAAAADGSADLPPGVPGDVPGEVAPDVAPDPLAVSDLEVVERPANPLSVDVTWATDAPAPTALEVDCGPDYQRRFDGEAPTTAHRVFVMGLIPGTACAFEVHPGQPTSGVTTATVDEVQLPDGLPALELKVLDADRVAPGWTMFSVNREEGPGKLRVVAVDAQGRYRWVHAPGPAIAGATYDLKLAPPGATTVASGILLGSLPYPSIVGWEGDVRWTFEERWHHDLRLSPFLADHLLMLGKSDVGCLTLEGTVKSVDMVTGALAWEWRACEHLVPRFQYDGWSHLNAVEPLPQDDALLLSSRTQDMLVLVDRTTGAVRWRLGVDGDFALAPEAVFLRQHAPEVQPGGTILLFDNGLSAKEAENTQTPAELVRPYSRALELALSFDDAGAPLAAEVVWEYVDPTLFARIRSEADRLANGNTLLHYCHVIPDQQTILREVTPEGEVVWDLWTPPGIASYRSERIAPRYGHVGDAP